MVRGRASNLGRLGLKNVPFIKDDNLELLYNFSNTEKEIIENDYYNKDIVEENFATSDSIYERSQTNLPWDLIKRIGTEYRSGINGSAIFFDGIDDNVLAGWTGKNTNYLPKARNNNYSAFLWFKILDIDNNNRQEIWDLRACGPNLRENNGTFEFYYNAGNSWDLTSTTINEGEWIFIVAQLNDKTMELYKNSHLKDTNSRSGDNTPQKNKNAFGYDVGSDQYAMNGLVDIAGYFGGKSLTQAEINKLYDATKPEGHNP